MTGCGNTEMFTTVIPSKLFECMGMGIPVLHGVEGESAEIVQHEAVGLLFEPENAGSLVAGLVHMRQDDGMYRRFKTAGPLAAQRYDRKHLAADMLHYIIQVAAQPH